MARMGQDSARAALIYQHASQQVDRRVADKLSALIEGETSDLGSTSDESDDDEEDGPAGALVPTG